MLVAYMGSVDFGENIQMFSSARVFTFQTYTVRTKVKQCCVLLCVLSGFAVVLGSGGGGGELVALLLLSCCRGAVCVLRLFLAVPWVGLHCVIVVFTDHTHLLFTQA